MEVILPCSPQPTFLWVTNAALRIAVPTNIFHCRILSSFPYLIRQLQGLTLRLRWSFLDRHWACITQIQMQITQLKALALCRILSILVLNGCQSVGVEKRKTGCPIGMPASQREWYLFPQDRVPWWQGMTHNYFPQNKRLLCNYK